MSPIKNSDTDMLSVSIHSDPEQRDVAVMAVGDSVESYSRTFDARSLVAYVAFDELSRDLLRRLSPKKVISPLLANRFDAIDLAQMLVSLGFSGQYVAIASTLPDPSLVQRDIRSLCPTLDFSIIEAPASD